MIDANPLQSQQERIAAWIIRDIQQRGLSVGDAYLNAAQLGGLFGVSRATADRAMKALATRGVLSRRQRAGTVVGPAAAQLAGALGHELSVVHVLEPTDAFHAAVTSAETFVASLSAVLPEAVVEVHIVPVRDALAHTKRLYDRLDEDRAPREAVVLIRGSHESQLIAQRSRVPTVVYGSVYQDVTQLPWIDVDQKQAGELAAGHALASGATRFVLITHDRWRRGDNLLHGGVTKQLAAANVGLERLEVCSLPFVPDLVARQVESILDETGDPTAFLCRSARYGEIVAEVINASDQGGNHEIIVMQAAKGSTALAHVAPLLTSGQQVERLGSWLKQMVEKGFEKPPSVAVPCEFIPAAAASEPADVR
jgi:DNA-binding LacI/PurR family transcriptional regulator